MAGLLGDKFNEWMTPDRGMAMQAIGASLVGLGSGRPANLAPAYAALQERKQNAAWEKRIAGGEFANLFTPEQNAVLAKMPAGLAQQIISSRLTQQFAPPTPPKYEKVGDELVRVNADGTVENVYGKPKVDNPAGVKEYEYAKAQGYPGTFQEWKADMAASGRDVNTFNIGGDDRIGTIPQGYMVVGEGENLRMVPIPGGPADVAASRDADKAAVREGEDLSQAELMTTEVARALAVMQENPSTTLGVIGQVLGNIPGTSQADLESLVTTIKGNLGFEQLQKIRDNSPTGGAVGQLSDNELRILSSMAGSLDLKQSRPQLEYNLKRIASEYQKMIGGGAKTPTGDMTPQIGGQPKVRVWNPTTGTFD